MDNNNHQQAIQYIKTSKFVRTVFVQIVAIFLVVIIAVVAIVFSVFAAETNRNISSERQKQLDIIESTVTKRINEISSIAYNIGADKAFYLEAVEGSEYSGEEMAKALEHFLVGNDFIEHLAYYRLSEPDVIYTSNGSLSFEKFWNSYLGCNKEVTDSTIEHIRSTKEPEIVFLSFGDDSKSFFAYISPLPQFSENPQAFVLMLIPLTQVKPILETQLSNCYGEIAIYDSDFNEIYKLSNLDYNDAVAINTANLKSDKEISTNGRKFIIQQKKSTSNSWTYISVTRINDIFSLFATKQFIPIISVFVLLILAIIIILWCIIRQYKPINNLAMALDDKNENDEGKSVIDEETLLSDKFESLRDDSEQKQKYEAAFYAAEAASKAKSTFLSNMSHDIRTPMNSIVGMTEIAMKNLDDPPYVKECLQKVRIASQYLLDIINNVLDMSRIESGKFTLSSDVIELPKLIGGIVTILNQSLDVKSQKLVIEIDNISNEKFIGDNVRLTQVFMNILSCKSRFNGNPVIRLVGRNSCKVSARKDTDLVRLEVVLPQVVCHCEG